MSISKKTIVLFIICFAALFLVACGATTSTGSSHSWVTKAPKIPYEGTPKIPTSTPGGVYPSNTPEPITPSPTPTMKYYGPPEEGPRYGVYLDLDGKDYEKIRGTKTVVIDPKKFTKDQVKVLKDDGTIVYMYLNIGNVTTSDAQESALKNARSLIRMGADGFLVDNLDTWADKKDEKEYEGIVSVLEELKKTGKEVILNNGDAFMAEYIKRNSSLSYIISGVNQECVYTYIDPETGKFKVRSKEDRFYLDNYLLLIDDFGGRVYLVEYTEDENVINTIKEACEPKAWSYYISPTRELTVK